jgi:hypothetical protein
MLKRHRIAKSIPSGAEEEFFTFRDLGIGNNISLYGRYDAVIL